MSKYTPYNSSDIKIDVVAEFEILSAWANSFSMPVTFKRNEYKYDQSDFEVTCNGRTALVEVKDRLNFPSTAFNTVLISESKLDYLCMRALLSGVPSILINRWNDGVIDWARIGETYPDGTILSHYKRSDRNYKCDDVQNVEIPKRHFKKIKQVSYAF